MSKKKLEDLMTMCEDFDGSDEEFREIVQLSLKLGVNKVELAEECGVAGSTVDKWGKGLSTPSLNEQGFVIGNIQYLLNKE